MKSNLIITGLLLTSVGFTQAYADTKSVEDRLSALEQSKLEISGELSATYDTRNKTQWGDAEITLSHKVNDNWRGSLTIKRDGETVGSEDRIIFDEAQINYNYKDFTASIGRIGVPFGAFDTSMITDPLTKSVADADKGGKDMVMLGMSVADFSVSAYTYKDTDNDSGISIGYEKDIFTAGLDYFEDGTSGFGNSMAYRIGVSLENGISLYYEGVKTDQGVSKGSHFEIGYNHKISGMDANISIASSEVEYGDKQKGLTYSLSPVDGILLMIENNKVDGNDAINTFKVVYEF